MKRFPVTKAREKLADVLNEADRNGAVAIERGGVQYVLRVRRAPRRARTARSVIETVDPQVAAGQWQWKMTAQGLRFAGRRRA